MLLSKNIIIYKGYKLIAKDLEIQVSTVGNVQSRSFSNKTVKTLPGHGAKKKLIERSWRKLVRIVEKTPHKTSTELQANLEQSEVAHTIRRTVNIVELHGQKPRRKPLLKERHKKARLMFAKPFIDKPTQHSFSWIMFYGRITKVF